MESSIVIGWGCSEFSMSPCKDFRGNGPSPHTGEHSGRRDGGKGRIMKASFENCMELVNSSIDNRNKIVDEYSKLLTELLESMTWTSRRGERFTLYPSYTHNLKVVSFHTNLGGETKHIEVESVAKHIIATTSNPDPEEALEEFVHYICTKIIPEFKDRGLEDIPDYLYV